MTLQDDVVDLNNKVVVENNEYLAADEELNEFVAYLKEKINEEVGEILAKAEQPAEEEVPAAQEEAAESADTQEDNAQQPVQESQTSAVQTVKATDVVNIRTSDSETADKIDKAQVGQEFRLLEQRGNGWSKVEFNGGDAYIKSEYLEVVPDAQVPAAGDEPQTASAQEKIGRASCRERV